jgi:transcriptional regulator with XRE-family HTH domain
MSTPDPPRSFAEFLPQLITAREQRGLHRRDVAIHLGLSQATIDSWERSHRTPTAVNAQRWADHLDVQLPDNTDGWFAKHDRAKHPRHGTRSGYQWHLRTGNMPACQPCREADNIYARQRRNAPDQ